MILKQCLKNAIHILSDEKRLAQFKTNAKEASEKFGIHEIVPLQYEKKYMKIRCVSVL